MISLRKIKGNLGAIRLFNKRFNLFKPFLQKLIATNSTELNETSNKKNIAVVIQPWMFSAVPFYSIVIGLFLKKRGNNVRLIFDSFDFGETPLLSKIQVYAIKKALQLLDSKLVVDLKKCVPVTEGNISTSKIKKMAGHSALHFFKGELLAVGRTEYEYKVYNQLVSAEPYIHSIFINNKYDCVFFPGGIYGTSCLYYELCQKYNVRPNTFDSDFGVLITSTNGIAAQLSDIPVAYNMIKKELNEAVFNHIYQIVHDQLDKRTNGKDHFNTQIVGQQNQQHPRSVDCLMVLNVSWDSAALGIHAIFNAYYEWVLHTVEQILNNTEENITIRQHPHERFPLVRSNDDFHKLLKDKFGQTDRIQFIDCNDNINTYELINKAKFIVAFSSTSGVEAVIMGKPVIIVSKCYYGDLGFVYSPKTIIEYDNLLKKGCDNKLQVTQDQINDAYLCYYVGICCNLIFTNFTPVHTDYIKWIKTDPEQLFLRDDIQTYLTSIDTGTPLAYLKFKEDKLLSVPVLL